MNFSEPNEFNTSAISYAYQDVIVKCKYLLPFCRNLQWTSCSINKLTVIYSKTERINHIGRCSLLTFQLSLLNENILT